MGRTDLSFDRWAKRMGWQPDARTEYCWRCGSSIGEHESDGSGCSQCRTKRLPWTRAIRLGRYDNALKAHVLATKFHHWHRTGKALGTYLGSAIAEQLDLAQIPSSDARIVPIPMHRFRRVTRGIDHTHTLAQSASRQTNCSLVPLLSARRRPEQIGLSMTARAQNSKHAYFVPHRKKRMLTKMLAQEPRVVILVDDVRTTGVTFVSACRTLKSAFIGFQGDKSEGGSIPEIWIASVCVAGESNRRNHISDDRNV
ncbi:MAG: ComF family protein [Phycisphaerales bacterium]